VEDGVEPCGYRRERGQGAGLLFEQPSPPTRLCGAAGARASFPSSPISSGGAPGAVRQASGTEDHETRPHREEACVQRVRALQRVQDGRRTVPSGYEELVAEQAQEDQRHRHDR